MLLCMIVVSQRYSCGSKNCLTVNLLENVTCKYLDLLTIDFFFKPGFVYCIVSTTVSQIFTSGLMTCIRTDIEDF